MSETIIHTNPVNSENIEIPVMPNDNSQNLDNKREKLDAIFNDGIAKKEPDAKVNASLKEMEEAQNQRELILQAKSIANQFLSSDSFNKIINGQLRLDNTNPNISSLFSSLENNQHTLQSKQSEVDAWQEKINRSNQALNVKEQDDLEGTKLQEIMKETGYAVEEYQTEQKQKQELTKANLLMKPLVMAKHTANNFMNKLTHNMSKNKLGAAEAIKQTKDMYNTYLENLDGQYNLTQVKIDADLERARFNALKAKALDESITQMDTIMAGMEQRKELLYKKLAEVQDEVEAVRKQNAVNGLDVLQISQELRSRLEEAETNAYALEEQIRNLQNAKNVAALEFKNSVDEASESRVQLEQSKANLNNLNTKIMHYKTTAKRQIVLWEQQMNWEQSVKVQQNSLEFIEAVSDASAKTALKTVDLVQKTIEQSQRLDDTIEKNSAIFEETNNKMTELYRQQEQNRSIKAEKMIRDSRAKMTNENFTAASALSKQK